MNVDQLRTFVDRRWQDSIVPALIDYVRIPAKSPAFDADWEAHGHIEAALTLIEHWCRDHALPGLEVGVSRLPGRTPLLYVDVPGDGAGTVLLYGHLDKQPEMQGWRDGLGPWSPVIDGDRLYGRGGADDGYAAFASLAAIDALAAQDVPRPRCVLLVEASEESGSPDLPAHVEALAQRIGTPDLVVCLDSGCGDYQRLWYTTSLRGMAAGTLHARILAEGVHSGDAGGVVPSAFRVLRALLDRLEDSLSGDLRLAALEAPIPPERVDQAAHAATILGDSVWRRFPLRPGVSAESAANAELVLRRTWHPALAVIGAAGLPAPEHAGNVALPAAALRLSLRLPPTCDAAAAVAAIGIELERDPPCGAEVRFTDTDHADGWNAPPMGERLAEAVDQASRTFFGHPSAAIGEGGTIPFMGMLGERFPAARFLVTGVLGPQSNAHGPNEFLDLPTARRLTCCVASVLASVASPG